ncbi:MAG: hypothetical protein ACC608_05935 [Anaerofustis sp.]
MSVNVKKSFKKLLEKYIHAVGYYEECFRTSVKINRGIVIFLAVASSASIGSWVLWQQYAIVWAVIIGASQVISVINEFLPYQKRIDDLPKLTGQLTVIYTDMKKCWMESEMGKLTDEQILEQYSLYESKWNDTIDDYFKTYTIPKDNKKWNEAGDRKVKEEFEIISQKLMMM